MSDFKKKNCMYFLSTSLQILPCLLYQNYSHFADIHFRFFKGEICVDQISGPIAHDYLFKNLEVK